MLSSGGSSGTKRILEAVRLHIVIPWDSSGIYKDGRYLNMNDPKSDRH